MRPTVFPCRPTSKLPNARLRPPEIIRHGAIDMNVAAHAFDRISDQPSGTRPSIADLKLRIASVSPQIKARAYTTEKSGRVPAENMLILREIGYFDIVKPRAFGGYECYFDVLVDLNIDLAKACASTAWVGGLLAAHQWLIASFPEQAQRDVWDTNPDALACGSYAPATKAVASKGGYTLTGRWSFASGCDNAQWSLC